jgi:hypothetical protein
MFTELRPRKDKRGVDLISMRCHSVGCGTWKSATQSATRNTTAAHMMLSFAFMMQLAK